MKESRFMTARGKTVGPTFPEPKARSPDQSHSAFESAVKLGFIHRNVADMTELLR
jgi:hypothetical protein